jgi:hypothetical protein
MLALLLKRTVRSVCLNSMNAAPQTPPTTCSATPAASSIESSAKCEPSSAWERITQVLKVNTPLAQLPVHWPFLGVRNSMRGRPQNPDSFFRDLRAELSDDELLAQGVATRDGNGQLRLSPIFADPDSRAFLIRSSDAGLSAAVVTRCGVLPSSVPEWRQLATVIVDLRDPRHEQVFLSAS